MAQYCTEPRKEEGGKSNQAGEYAHINLNLSQEGTYIDVEGFEMFRIGVNKPISASKTMDAYITGIERCILGGSDKHTFLNKGNKN